MILQGSVYFIDYGYCMLCKRDPPPYNNVCFQPFLGGWAGQWPFQLFRITASKWWQNTYKCFNHTKKPSRKALFPMTQICLPCKIFCFVFDIPCVACAVRHTWLLLTHSLSIILLLFSSRIV